ncbi:MAG: O-Antigen ligase [Actinomycetota bacterium]|nr:O-Antigen ligase [Actinomycetota bacterium]
MSDFTAVRAMPAGPVPGSVPGSGPGGRMRWFGAPAVDWLVAAVAAGTGLLTPTLPLNLAPVDPLILLVNVLAFAYVVSGRRTRATRLLATAAPWFWLFLISSFLSLFGVGLAPWAIDNLLRDMSAILTCFTFLILLGTSDTSARKAQAAICATGVLVALTVWLFGGGDTLRLTGATFSNPNYTGHFLATALLLAVAGQWPRSRGRRTLLVVLYALAITRTGSFGALLILGGALGYSVWRSVGSLRSYLRTATRLALILLLLTGLGIAAHQVVGEKFDAGAGFSSERLGRSGDTRLAIWHAGLSTVDDHPLGAGPGSAAALSLTSTDADSIGHGTELHSDPLGLLVENGILGLVAVIAIAAVLWRAVPPGGITRTLMFGLGVGSFVRETINFRHLWVAIAIAVALDWKRRDQAAERVAGERVAGP